MHCNDPLLLRTLARVAASARALAAISFSLAISSRASVPIRSGADEKLRLFVFRCCCGRPLEILLVVVEKPSTDSIEARAASAMVETMHMEMLDRDEDDDDDDIVGCIFCKRLFVKSWRGWFGLRVVSRI